jgi:uncharacterized protein
VSHTLFDGHRRLAAGPLPEMAVALANATSGGSNWLLLFEDGSGRQVDVDTRGSAEEIAARYAPTPDTPPDSESSAAATQPHRGPGRPRLGVVAREVTLLPHHWEWLSAQPGGASVTLRKLVEHARKSGAEEERTRTSREAAYRFLHALAGNFPEYEEVTRALFAGDLYKMRELMLVWPTDVREHALALANA